MDVLKTYTVFVLLDDIVIIYLDDTFNPTIDISNNVIKNNLQKSADSLKCTMPTITVPTAPMPVQIA